MSGPSSTKNLPSRSSEILNPVRRKKYPHSTFDLLVPAAQTLLMSDKASSKPLQKPLMAKPQLTRSEAKVQSTTVVSAPAKPRMLSSDTKYNPLKRMKKAWTTTNGVSGKICMVLFYAVIVGKIAWAIKDLIYPKVCVLYYVRSVEKIYFRCDPLALFSNLVARSRAHLRHRLDGIASIKVSLLTRTRLLQCSQGHWQC